MKLEYDKEVDAAYIYLKKSIKNGEVKNSKEIKKDIIFDFDKDGFLIAVEILNASKILKKNVLDQKKVKKSYLGSCKGLGLFTEKDRLDTHN